MPGEARRTHEEVVGVGIGAANFEELHKIVELAVDVAAHGNGAFLMGISRVQRVVGVDLDVLLAGHWIPLVGLLAPEPVSWEFENRS